MKIQPVRGTHDLYGEELCKYTKFEDAVRNFAELYNFNKIITPIFESSELFKKPLGEHSDVVLKEMYTFKDRNESSLTLRPEHTTPILRAAISNNLLLDLPTKLYSIGPAFRRERPQKGRYRQFNQINFEILGTHDILSDVELIILADNVLKEIFPNKKIDLYINSLGDKNTLKKFKSELSDFYEKNKNKLSQESKDKINNNPLRILDSKDTNDIEINNKAPKISNYYTEQTQKNFIEIQKLLSENSINYIINQNLVRGLDYYCQTVFEFKSKDLGTQDTLIGGGRYDGLLKILNGPDLPGVGWAGGIERILMLMESVNKKQNCLQLIIMDEKFKNYALKIANKLRSNNIAINFNYKYNLKKSLSRASQIKSNYVIIIGEKEFNENLCTIKNLNKNTQETTTIEEIISKLI